MALTVRQEKAMLNYKANGGNMKKAMIDAGYSELYADRNSQYLLGIIGEQIKEEQEQIRCKKIKTVEEIQEWWSANVDNDELDIKDRLKSSELLVRSQGGFIDNLKGNINVSNKLEDLL